MTGKTGQHVIVGDRDPSHYACMECFQLLGQENMGQQSYGVASLRDGPLMIWGGGKSGEKIQLLLAWGKNKLNSTTWNSSAGWPGKKTHQPVGREKKTRKKKKKTNSLPEAPP